MFGSPRPPLTKHDLLKHRIRALQELIAFHNSHPPDRTNHAAVQTYNAEAAELNREAAAIRRLLQ
jgi:hypothetical protein